MIAIVTDRPNVGREIARVLGADRKENGYMTGNGYMVTWTYGNMLSLAMPKDSGTARVEWKDFPLLPPSFLTVRHVKTDTGWNPDINALLQLKIIAKVLNACDTIIAATDASREGEMLFRHLYGFLECKQPCFRLWISSLTDEAITEGMANLLPCDRFDNLFLAADSRNRADWLLGVNSSYAICKAVGFGNNSLGRVQTPVLAEICRRYRERENFLPADSWPVFVSLCKDRQIIKLRHTEDFQEYRYASELYGDCKAVRNARIATVSRESEDIRAPAPYNLTELQKDANRYHNLTAIQVQDITQGLYEKKLISYPRTASRLLTRDVYDTLPAVMEKILSRKEFRQYAKMTDFAAPPSDISAQETTDHHAIIVTGMPPRNIEQGGTTGLYAHSRQDTRSLHAILPGGIYDHRRSMCRTEVQRPNVPRPEKGVAQHLRAGTSYRKGGYALFRTTGFLPGRAGTGKRMQYRPQENTSGIPLYG